MDARHPERPGPHRRRHRDEPRGDAGERGDRPRGHACATKTSVDLAAVVINRVLPELFGQGRGGAVRAAPRAGTAGGARPRGRWLQRRWCSTPRSSRCDFAARAPRISRRCARSSCLPRTTSTCPSCSRRAKGLRATKQIAEALGEELGLLMARRPTSLASGSLDCAARVEGDRGHVRLGWSRKDHDRRGRRRDGGRAPGAGCSCSPSTPHAVSRTRWARGVRQRRAARRRRRVRGGRCRASRRAVGRDARHEAVVGRPRASARSRRRDSRRDPGEPALREHHDSLRAQPRLHRDGAPVRHPRDGRLRPARRRHATVAQRARLPRRAGADGRVLQQSPAAMAHRALSVSGDDRGVEALLPARRSHPRLAVPPGHRRVLHPLPDDARRVRRASPRRAARARRQPHDVRRREHARAISRSTRPSSSSMPCAIASSTSARWC